MSENRDIPEPHDICLLLRSHGEQRWLISQVVPVLRQLEEPSSIPDDQLGAALAYLEVLWLDACRRAAETDTACAKLDLVDDDRDRALYEEATRYCTAVRSLRTAVGHRVALLTRLPAEPVSHEHAHS